MKKAGVKYPKNGKKWGTIGKEIFKAEAEVITKQAFSSGILQLFKELFIYIFFGCINCWKCKHILLITVSIADMII
jgi:hypothetical protein